MSQERPGDSSGRPGPGDAWSIVAYLLSGLIFWGAVGWLLDRWVGNENVFLLIVLLVGMASAIYLVYVRFGRA